MVLKDLCVLVLWANIASAMEGLTVVPGELKTGSQLMRYRRKYKRIFEVGFVKLHSIFSLQSTM